MKILVLTDHITHSVHNSVYNIVTELFRHPFFDSVYVASRGLEINADFFQGKPDSEVWGIKIQDTFHFPADDALAQSTKLNLTEINYVLLRLPRPIPPLFFPYLNSLFDEKKIVNRPSGIIRTSNKSYLLEFQKYTPPIALCTNWKEIQAFAKKHACVLKPLEEYGGNGIVRMKDGEAQLGSDVMTMTAFKKRYQENPIPYLAMKYLKNVRLGDKRIVVANGEILASSLRLPAEGGWLCNVAQGGSSENATVDAREKEIIECISPILKREGIFLFGLDTLVDDDGQRVISEVNTLSVGGITPSELNSGKPINKRLIEQFVSYISETV